MFLPRHFTIILFPISAILLGGCSYSELDMINHSRGVNYSQGYGDGCATAKSKFDSNTTTIVHEDKKRYQTQSKYKDGWNTGYSECYFRLTKEKRLNIISNNS